MEHADNTNSLLQEALEAIDSGNLSLLKHLLQDYPQLVRTRFDEPTEGYFKHPYLLWFVADNPIRRGALPANIMDITQLLIQFVRQHASESFQEQIDYALGLVATGRIPRECGVQIALIDLLIDAGATPRNGLGALAHGNAEAAQRLIERGGKLTLATAIGLNRTEAIDTLANESTATDRQIALMVAAFYGKADWLTFLIRLGVDVNAYLDPSSGFHSHTTALHQAVYSGSLESVSILVKAGADLELEDRIYHGTPLGWAMHGQTDGNDIAAQQKYAAIAAFLQAEKSK